MNSRARLMAMTASMISISSESMNPTKLSNGLHMLLFLNDCDISKKPKSTMEDGLAAPVPDACEPMDARELMMSRENSGPFLSSHKKNPKNSMNLTNSAKNSPMSAFLSSIMPKVNDSDIAPSV